MRYPLMATSWSPRPTKPAHGEDGSIALMTASLQMPPTSQMGCTCRVVGCVAKEFGGSTMWSSNSFATLLLPLQQHNS